MSIASQTSRVDYVGNGNTSEYDFTFLIFSESDLLVSVRDADDVQTTLVLDTDYTVDGVGDANGGSITLLAGNLDSGNVITIRRVRELTQETDIRNQGEFFPETHEDTFDHLIMVDQQQQDEIDRSIKLPETVAASGFDSTLPSNIGDSGNAVLTVNSEGNGFALATPDAGDPLISPSISGDVTFGNGDVLILKSPDGTKTIRFGVDNNGNFGDMT